MTTLRTIIEQSGTQEEFEKSCEELTTKDRKALTKLRAFGRIVEHSQ